MAHFGFALLSEEPTAKRNLNELVNVHIHTYICMYILYSILYSSIIHIHKANESLPSTVFYGYWFTWWKTFLHTYRKTWTSLVGWLASESNFRLILHLAKASRLVTTIMGSTSQERRGCVSCSLSKFLFHSFKILVFNL